MNNNNKKLHMNNNKKKKINLHLFTLKGYNIVCYHIGQMYPPVEAFSDKEQYYVRSA